MFDFLNYNTEKSKFKQLRGSVSSVFSQKTNDYFCFVLFFCFLEIKLPPLTVEVNNIYHFPMV